MPEEKPEGFKNYQHGIVDCLGCGKRRYEGIGACECGQPGPGFLVEEEGKLREQAKIRAAVKAETGEIRHRVLGVLEQFKTNSDLTLAIDAAVLGRGGKD